jgi:hypothetical protein
MKKITFFVTLILLFLLSGCYLIPSHVSIAQVLSNPQKYDGKNITIEGYLFSGWEWFGIAESYEFEDHRPMKSTGGWIDIRWDPEYMKVSWEDVYQKITEIENQLFVDNYAVEKSLFGKVRVTGKFQFFSDKGPYQNLVATKIDVLSWSPPASSAAPAAHGELTLSESPVLGKPIQVIYTFWLSENSGQNNADATANISIPNAFELVDGALQWQGNLSKGGKVELKATVKAIKKGTCEITAKISFAPSPGSNFSNYETETIYALVLSDRGFFSHNRADLPGEGGPGRPGPAMIGPYMSEYIAILLDLSLPHPPALGETTELTLVATAMTDAPGARIAIQLPESLSLVSGDLVWTGDMTKGDRIELRVMVKATAVGVYNLYGNAYYATAPKYTASVPSYAMILYIFKDGADTIEFPPVLLPKQ